eukprot:NODE_520_length_6539_cov_0.561801.p1 type:complete len:256 gc:universal NODE_520_length_6539_cov_0.561801:2954-3721(+)
MINFMYKEHNIVPRHVKQLNENAIHSTCNSGAQNILPNGKKQYIPCKFRIRCKVLNQKAILSHHYLLKYQSPHNHEIPGILSFKYRNNLANKYPHVIEYIFNSKKTNTSPKAIYQFIQMSYNIHVSINIINNLKIDYFDFMGILDQHSDDIIYHVEYTTLNISQKSIKNLKYIFIFFQNAFKVINIPSPIIFDSTFNICNVTGLRLVYFCARDIHGKTINVAAVYLYEETNLVFHEILNLLKKYYIKPIGMFMTD